MTTLLGVDFAEYIFANINLCSFIAKILKMMRANFVDTALIFKCNESPFEEINKHQTLQRLWLVRDHFMEK